MDELKRLGIETLFVTVLPVKDLNDRMMGGMRGLFAEYERAKISERFRMGKQRRVDTGNILLSEAPYGYTYIPNTGKKGTGDYHIGHLIINEEEKKIVTMLFKLVGDEGLTLRAVVRKLHELGIKPRKSKRGVWNTSTLSTLFRNQTYIGKAHWGVSYAVEPENPLKDVKYRKIKKTSRRINPEEKWATIKVERIIDASVGQRLRDNFALMGRNKKNEYLLAGKIWCTCGRRRTGEGPQHGKHLYYRCSDRVYSAPLARKCYEGGINARISDQAVWDRLNKIITTPELMIKEAKKWQLNYKTTQINKEAVDIESTKQEISKLKNRADKYTNAYSEEVITIQQLKNYLTPLQERISSLEKILERGYSQQKSKLEIVAPNDQEIKLLADKALEVWKNLSFTAKKDIIRQAVTRIVSTQTELQVHGFLNLGELYELFSLNNEDNTDKIKLNSHVKYFPKYRHSWLTECR